MTIKEAALKSLEDLNRMASYSEVYQHIIDKKYYDFGSALTPAQPSLPRLATSSAKATPV